MISVGVLTVSDKGSRGERKDQSGPTIIDIITERLNAKVKKYEIVPDERDQIEGALIEWADVLDLDLILTTGGTGFAPRDVTPEATKAVIHREAPGLAEAMRAESMRVTPHGMLSRALAGIRSQTLIVNLPGSQKAVEETLNVILPALPHAIELLRVTPGADQRHEYEK
jgi:molybdenum cofactor synthesis domain-containing protein